MEKKKSSNMRIFKWDRFNDIIENRIKKIDLKKFKSLLENCHNYNSTTLYKKIYQPDFEIGLFEKSVKITENYINKNNDTSNIDESFPDRNYSLVCSTENLMEDDDTTLFVVLPYKESLFTIKSNEGYLKGYWKDKIKWIEKFNENKVWTDSTCLLIRKDIWDSMNESVESYNTRDVLATTLIGETGGDNKDAPMVLNVLKNRAKKRGTTPAKEALRKYQFSMWNKHYTKGVSVETIIDEYKKNKNWSKENWDYVYSLVDKINSLKDNTNGANMYYAHKKTLPYWANNDSTKMKELGKEWKVLAKNHQHTFGTIM
jgi:hypothetical protein